MAHKFQPADEKYWAEQKVKHEQARIRHKLKQYGKTTFNDIFAIEDTVETTKQGKIKQ